jgi:hypothetical protein
MSYKYKDKEILTPMTPFFEKAAKELDEWFCSILCGWSDSRLLKFNHNI